jgi:hypothetical protein
MKTHRQAASRPFQFRVAVSDAPRGFGTAAVRVEVDAAGVLDAHLDPLGEAWIGVPELGSPRLQGGGESVGGDAAHASSCSTCVLASC